MLELQIPNYEEIVSNALELKIFQVKIVLDLTREWATVPFIARYRKEVTGNLDENEIRNIIELQKKEENLYNAKVTAINWITETGLMTEELMQNIINAKTLKEVEEIYKPFKSKKKTKAMIAIEKWFQVVADSIKEWKITIPENLLNDYSREEIIEGSIEIIWAEISANSELRHYLIWEMNQYWIISSKKKSDKMLEKLNEKDKEQIQKFEIYFEFETRISRIKPYQTLALNRWENLWILNVKLEKDEIIFDKLHNKYGYFLNYRWMFIEELEQAFKIWYEALFSSVENEIRSDLGEIAEDDSIKVFQTNLKALLMTKPSFWSKILAIDPWFRAWCKLVVLDELWNPLEFDKMYLHALDQAKFLLKELIKKYWINVIVIWNWTATDEAQKLVLEIFSWEVYIVNESWASVYSVSKVAEEEFPKLDSLDRWTVSIWRRFIDPLSELVKVPVWSIGVWMYQHDIPEKKLEEKLSYVVEDSVNEVWINVNTASIYLLNHISWIDKRQAKKIYENRPYASRVALKKVLWEKAYEQAAWFLRIPESKEKLDNTDIHPEQYELAKYIIETWSKKIDEEMKKLYPQVNNDTIDFIITSYQNIWLEKRVNVSHTKAEKEKSVDEIKVWDIVIWTVRNVVAFGAFVDIWLKNDWLVHISQMVDRFISDPNEIVKVGDKVKVKITGIDEKTKKVQLSMKEV
jgi:protein Tex